MIEKVNNLFSSLIENIQTRAQSPIIASFCISWIIVNWKIILVFLFMDGNILIRIQTIEKFEEFDNYCRILWIPAIMSSFYTIAMPFLNIWIQRLLKQTHSEEIEMSFFQKELLLEKNSNYENKKRKLQEDSNINLNIENLTQELTNKEHEISRLHGEVSNKNNEIERLLVELKDYEDKLQRTLARQQEEFNMAMQRNNNNHQGEIDRIMRERSMMETDFQDRMQRHEASLRHDFQNQMEQRNREHSIQEYHWKEELQRKKEEFQNQLQREKNQYQHQIDDLNRKIKELSSKTSNI